jgi:hypothetical protein
MTTCEFHRIKHENVSAKRIRYVVLNSLVLVQWSLAASLLVNSKLVTGKDCRCLYNICRWILAQLTQQFFRRSRRIGRETVGTYFRYVTAASKQSNTEMRKKGK